MSICDVWTSKDFAIVAVDTKGSGGFEFSKMMPIPHAGVLLAFRGQRITFQLALDLITCWPEQWATFDELVKVLPLATEAAGKKIEAIPDAPSGTDSRGGIELQVVAVGWSDRLQRMAATEAVFVPGKEVEVSLPEEFGGIVTPCAPEEEEAAWRLPFDTEPGEFQTALMDLAARQVAYGRKHWPQHGFGGKLLFATLSRTASGTDLGIQPLGLIPELAPESDEPVRLPD